ncbi:MAG TPA: hypothetical protein VGE62_01100 [Candidatus Paceibacterota bacterium]
MELLSERYGWTPDEIKTMSQEDIENYTAIISMKNKMREKAEKANKGRAR